MKLRFILRVLSLLAFLSACAAGYLYYSFLRDYAFQEIEKKALDRLAATKKNLSAFLSENSKPVRTLASMQPLADVLTQKTPQSLHSANAILDLFKKTLDVDVCYIMDPDGITVASSNRNDPDSFVGMDFSFRPYFQDAVAGLPANYLALGASSRKRGAYYSYPIYQRNKDIPVGIAVIKAPIFFVEKELTPERTSVQLVVDPVGMIFISSRSEWLYHLLWELEPNEIRQLQRSRQFGDGPWRWTGIRRKGNRHVVDKQGNTFLFHQIDVDNYPGWKIVHLYDLEAASRSVSAPVEKILRPVIILFCSLLGLSILFLYRHASMEIARRRRVEEALRKSEERYRSLYNHTPAMLHSIDRSGRLVSVSDYWSEVLGYEKNEVIGKKLTHFLSSDSREYAEQEIIPTFFKKGFINNVPYQFVKKSGDPIDVQLSAITDYDDQRDAVRSLAVSIDVTERNRAERALQKAKESLAAYSKNLETLVQKRTQEISGILTYTPAAIYIKDEDGKYKMVNSKFEALFGIKNEDVRGKTDLDFLARGIADQFRKNDGYVLERKQSIQAEEQIVVNGVTYTYLSTKFPLYGNRQQVTGVCSIATDISALKNAQKRLQRLSASIMTSQENERAYIARELHDELGQVLTALRMEAVWICNRLKMSDPATSSRALTMVELIDTTIETVRGLAVRLRPGVLDHLGLVDAIEWYTTDFEKRYAITCLFSYEKGPDIRGNLATAAYRIAQEALTNIARHASATRARVSLSFQGNQLRLAIQDNGKGFDPESLDETQSLGVVIMRERANLVRGRLEVESTIDGGTKIRFSAPVTKQQEKTDVA